MKATTSIRLSDEQAVVRADTKHTWHEVSIPMRFLVGWLQRHRPALVAKARGDLLQVPPGFELVPCCQCAGSGKAVAR